MEQALIRPWETPVDLTHRREKLLTHRLRDYLPAIRAHHSLKSFRASELYAAIKSDLDAIIFGHEYGFYNEEPTGSRAKKFYRAVFWNLSGEVNYDSLLDVLKNHPILRKTDFFLFAGADIGMARTKNRNIVRSLAIELSCNYAFACSHLYVMPHPKLPGSENHYGLVGQAVMTPHPLKSFVTIPLKSSVDPFRRETKRLGHEKAIVARVALPNLDLNVVCAKLDTSSSPRQRARQIKTIFAGAAHDLIDYPLLFGGGLNTTTYDSRHAVPQFFSFFNKVVRGYDFICEEHHPHPEKHFDRKVFDALMDFNLRYGDMNELGVPTFHCPFEELEVQGHKEKMLSHMMVKTLTRYFYHGGGELAFKTDWFAANARVRPSSLPQAERPKVLANLYHDTAPISTHDPIVVDFEVV